MKHFFKALAGAASMATATALVMALYAGSTIPDKIYVTQGQELKISSPFTISATSQNTMLPVKHYDRAGNTYDMSLRLFGSVSVKQVQVQVVKEKQVIPSGIPFGIKMFTEGVIVVGMSDVDSGKGLINPSKLAGIQVGDIITSIGGKKVASNEQLEEVVKHSGGSALKVMINRSGEKHSKSLLPVQSVADNEFKAGIWVRDSSAGIGTMTYLDPVSGSYAGLGHAVCDVDTQLIMPLNSGEIVRANINGVQPGEAGAPGELKGVFIENMPMGSLLINSETGVFGKIYKAGNMHEPVTLAQSHEVHKGPATVLCTVEGELPREFTINIDKINSLNKNDTKNMVISVTDKELLGLTGGIVQGMSGSPIMQDGKLVGAVTHVFVNDPTKGFAIFVENMDNTMKTIESSQKLAS